MRRASKGATLIEVLIAMTIMGILASGVFGAFVYSQRITTSTEARLMALELTQQTAEELRAAIGEEFRGGASALTVGVHTVADGMGALDRFSPVRTYTVRNGKFQPDGTIDWATATDADYDIKEVRVKVEWTPPVGS